MLRLFSILLIVAFTFIPVQVHAATLSTDGSWVVIGGEYNMGGTNKINEESRVRFVKYFSDGTAQLEVQLRTWATGGKRVNCTCGYPIDGPWTYWTSDFDIYVNGTRVGRIEPTDVKHYHGSGKYTESMTFAVQTGVNLHIVVDPVNPWGPGYSSVAAGGGEGNIDVTIPKQTISISYNTNGGTPSSLGSQTVNAGDGFNLRSDVLRKTGYIHSGWNTNSSGTGVNYSLGQWTSFSSSITLYAKWTPNTYTVRYNGNGNTGGSTASSSHTYGTAKNLTANGFTKTGYHFIGWATSSTGNVAYSNGQSVSNLTSTNGGTVDLYAKWAPNSYTVTYNGNGNTSGSTATSTHTYDTWKTLTANGFHKTGYLFVNWNLNSAGTSTSYSNGQNVLNLTTVQNGNINLYAQWTPVKYKISFNGNGATSGSMSTIDATYDVSQNLPANQFKRTGYDFAGWNTKANGTGTAISDGGAAKNLTTTNGAEVVLYAQWNPIKYTITLDANGGTYEGKSTHTVTVPYDTTYTFTQPERYGYKFMGWTLKGGDSSSVPIEGNFSTKGNIVKINGKQFRVLSVNGSKVKVLMMDSYTSDYFNRSSITTSFGSYTGQKYAGSDLDDAMTSYYNSLPAIIRNAIVEQNISQSMYSYLGDSSTTETSYVGITGSTYTIARRGSTNVGMRKVYALDVDDIFEYLGPTFTGSQINKMIFDSNDAVYRYIWLRSAYYNKSVSGSENKALTYRGKEGRLSDETINYTYREIHPVFVIDLDLLTSTSGVMEGYTWNKNEKVITQSPYTGVVYEGTYTVKNLRYKPGTVTFVAKWEPCTYTVRYYELMHPSSSTVITYDVTAWVNGNPYSVAGVDEFGKYTWRKGYLIYNVGTKANYVKRSSSGSLIQASKSFTSPNTSLLSVNGVYTNLVPQNKVSTSYLTPAQNNPSAGYIQYINLLNYDAQKELWRKMVNGESYSLNETDVHIFAVFDDTVAAVRHVDDKYYVEGVEYNPKYEDGSIHYTNKDVTVKYSFYDGFSGIKTIRYMLGTSELKRWNYGEENDVAQAEGLLTISNGQVLTKLGPTTATVSLTFANNVSASQNYYLEVTDYSGNVSKFPISINCIDKTPPKLEDWIFQLCSGSITTSTNQPKKITASDTQSGVDYIEYVLSYTDEWGKPVQKKYRIEGSSGWMEVVPNPSNAVKIDIKVVDKATNVFETQNCQYTNYMEAESGVSLIDYNYLFGKYDEMFGRAEYDSDVTESNALEFIEALEQDTNDAAVSCLRWLQAKVKNGSTEAEALREFMDIYLYYRH